MTTKRQAHGLSRLGNFVYACGGINSPWGLLDSCERYDLVLKKWRDDLPKLK